VIDPESLDLATLTALAGGAVERQVLAALHDAGFAGVRAAHGFVVQRLIESEPTVSELAAELGVTQQAASKTVAEMERIGIARRVADPADQRARRVRLTDRGREMVAESRRRRAEFDAAGTVAEVATARRVLLAVLERAGGLDAARERRVPPSG
jgi:DNA-binding MarR family transcriptional regulator